MSDLLAVPRDELTFEVLEPVVEEGEIRLRYRIHAAGRSEELAFTERVVLPGDAPEVDALPAHVLRLLALAAAPSYYKTCVPGRIAVPAGLTSQEERFLTEVITHGLGEFAYRNDVPEALHPRIEAPRLPPGEPAEGPPGSAPGTSAGPVRPLVAVGGGKDSIVTLESVRALTVPGPDGGELVRPTLFSVNEYEPIRATAEASGLPLLVARRRLDPLLFELNDRGALNGHVPVTAVNSLVGVLAAVHTGHDAVVFSNEASSSFGNVRWHGIDVNHQWSKGIGFERLLQEGLGTGTVSYFSFLRPLTELAIMRRFAALTGYHPVFTSCNRAFHLDATKRSRWCGDCPKCRFVFLCLAPFVPREVVLGIFTGRDLLADPAQREGFLELLDVGDRIKPFECVGEPDECRAAATLLSRHEAWADHPFLADDEVRRVLLDEAGVAAAFAWREDHALPPAYEQAARALL